MVATRHLWLMPVFLATQEAEIRIVVQASPGKQFARPYFENTQHKNSCQWLKCKGQYVPSQKRINGAIPI
jgi:hypothetical protein